jgi:hypothetical protein
MLTALLTVGVASILPAQTIDLRGLGGWGWSEKALGLGLAQGQPTDLNNLYSGAIGGAATLSVPLGQVDAFVGATLLYHFGGRLKLDLGNRVDRDDLSLVFYGGELGFTRLKAPVIVRTGSAIGLSRVTRDRTMGGTASSSSNSDVAFAPGALVAVPLGPVYVGLETKYLIVDKAPNGVALYGTIGIQLRR